MFDVNVTKETPAYPQNINITKHEHRAPTDKSVELLKEFEEKALAKLVRTIEIKDNIIDGAIYIFELMDLGKKQVVMRFIINGKEFMEREMLVDNFASEGEVIERFYKVVTDRIYECLVKNSKELGRLLER